MTRKGHLAGVACAARGASEVRKSVRRDEHYMQRAIELALKGWGKTSPNPLVGAVVVKGSRVIGEGYHRKAGTPHAEIHAIRQAGGGAQGATLYVTLEPCCHRGRTPPCVERIIKAGVTRVVIGTLDPNPIVHRNGARALRRAGITVRTGVLRDACREINHWYETALANGRPFVMLKVAMSMDGKIATFGGASRWITGGECRAFVHRLRAGSDAVVVGRGTVVADDPQLTVRLPGRRPRAGLAIVLDEDLSIPDASRVLKRPKGSLIFATTDAASDHRIEEIRDRGFDVIVCPHNRRGHISLPHLMRDLYKRRIISVLVEGGGETFADFIRQDLVDHVVLCIAPRIIGGEGRDAFPGIRIELLDDAISLGDFSLRRFGGDVVVEGSFARGLRARRLAM